MLQCVTPLTLQLNQFILKQQIFLKGDPRDVVLNRVALLQPFYSFPDVLLPHILVFNGFSYLELFSFVFQTRSHTFNYCMSCCWIAGADLEISCTRELFSVWLEWGNYEIYDVLRSGREAAENRPTPLLTAQRFTLWRLCHLHTHA